MVTIQPKQTLGQHLDAVLSAAGHDVTIAKQDVQSFGAKVAAWVSANWVHVAGYASIVATLKKLI